MPECQQIRPLLGPVHEGEATPEEAILVARHISDCTACRILLARERRLMEILSRGLNDLDVSEEFVQEVMHTLPSDPPQKPITRKKRGGIKLASYFF
jgi:predicted anti-sigma-YlaC factor YlaD